MTSIDCCHGCKTRSAGCHGRCGVYLELRARRDAEMEEERRRKDDEERMWAERRRANNINRCRRYRERKKKRYGE